MKKNTEDFIRKSRSIHGDKYDYSLVDYEGVRKKVKIICPIHGLFEQTPEGHYLYECKKCGNKKTSEKLSLSKESFIERSDSVYSHKYDYSLVNYKNMTTKVKIICPIHGVFEQLPLNHLLKKRGCNSCGNKITREKQTETSEDFIRKAIAAHGNKYDYSLVDYKKSREKVKIICPIHGVFEQIAGGHVRGNGCFLCNSSKGEERISLFFKNEDIFFIREYRFYDCRSKLPLPFDFYLPDYNTCVEYDGEQHYKKSDNWGGAESLNKTIKHDNIKNLYCEENDIKLIRIPYWNFENIEKILKGRMNESSLDK